MASLSALPAEILSRIAQYLVKANLGFEDDGICSLRLTCRATCLKTQYEFGRAAFSTLRLDLHPNTLQQLLTVCECPAFGEAVKKVVFAHWGDEYVSFSGVERDNEEELTTLEEQVRYVIPKIFKDAFGGLPNLKEVVIAVPFIARFQQQNSVSNTESSLEQGEASGDVFQDSRPGQESFRVEEFSVTADVLYSFIIDAAFSTGCRLSSIETTQSTPDCERKKLPAFSILEDRFAKSLSKLKYIQHLNLELHARPFSSMNDDGTDIDDIPPKEQFSNITNTMQQLVTLRLRFIGQKRLAEQSLILETICTPSDPNLSRLANLTLSTVLITEDALATLLLNHKSTLRSLGFHYVHLTGSWTVILNILLDELPVLDQLCLHALKERSKYVFTIDEDRLRSSFNYWGGAEMVAGIENMIRTMCFYDY